VHRHTAPRTCNSWLLNCCVKKRQTFLHPTCGLQTAQISVLWITRSGLSCSIVNGCSLMSGAVLNSRFLTRLLTSGEEDIERVSITLYHVIRRLFCVLVHSVVSRIAVIFRYTFYSTEAGIIRVLDRKMKNNIYSHALHIYSAYLVPIANHISVLHYSLINVKKCGLYTS